MTNAAVHQSHARPRHDVEATGTVQDERRDGSPQVASQKRHDVPGQLIDCVSNGKLRSVITPIAVDCTTAGAMFGVSKRSWARLHSGGGCPMPIRIGRSTRWLLSDLLAWAAEGCPSRQRFLESKQAKERARARGGRR